MNWTSIATVTRRELEEILNDPRMVIPLLILTFVVPLLLVLAVLATTHDFTDLTWAQSLLPLVVPFCGAFPAGFSVYNASESFVGEKERNTLESLLATPVTDGAIYLGKLVSALVLPLCTSSLAIVTFSTTFALLTPGEAQESLQLWFVVPVMALSALKVTILVAGSVAVSIHATSIRGANLAAGFLSAPLGAIVNLEAMLVKSERLGALAGVGAALAVVAAILTFLGWATFKREIILAQEHRVARGPVLARLYSRFRGTSRIALDRNY